MFYATHDRMVMVFLIAALLLVPSFAGATVTIEYVGETDDIKKFPVTNGGSDTLWDYVYRFTDSVRDTTPRFWGIRVDCPPPSTIGGPLKRWTGYWVNNMYDVDTSLPAGPGVYWWTNDAPPPDESTLGFRYQSSFAPVLHDWSAFDGSSGTEWSASPEPASMLLTSLALFGVGYWRRKKTR